MSRFNRSFNQRRRGVSLRRIICIFVTVVALLAGINVIMVFQSSGQEMIKKEELKRPADGKFNNVPIYSRRSADFHSTAHCIGETHDPNTAWMHRSCHFKNLCFDTSSKDFFLVKGLIEEEFQKRRTDDPPSFISTSMLPKDISLALGSINPRWNGTGFNQGIHKIKWSPKILDGPPAEYYMLPDNAVLIPFHSFAAHNVGHLLWDDLYAIYLLLGEFGFLSYEKVLLRVDTLPILYGTCEMRRKKAQRCAQNFEKFLPLIGVDPSTFSTTKHARQSPSAPTVICGKTAVAGLGMLSDHGLKDHGWNPASENHVHNVGKGALLYQFRNFMLHNFGLPLIPSQESRFRILLSAHSSGDSGRDLDFQAQYQRLHSALPSADVQVVELDKLPLADQLSLASQSNVYISTCGGGAMTATFLPRGASLILLYDENGGLDFANFSHHGGELYQSITGGPAYLDWDLLNNAGYLQVHWLPIGSINTPQGLDSLEYLVRHEIDVATNGI